MHSNIHDIKSNTPPSQPFLSKLLNLFIPPVLVANDWWWVPRLWSIDPPPTILQPATVPALTREIMGGRGRSGCHSSLDPKWHEWTTSHPAHQKMSNMIIPHYVSVFQPTFTTSNQTPHPASHFYRSCWICSFHRFWWPMIDDGCQGCDPLIHHPPSCNLHLIIGIRFRGCFMVWVETLGTPVAGTYVILTMRLCVTHASEFPSTESLPLRWGSYQSSQAIDTRQRTRDYQRTIALSCCPCRWPELYTSICSGMISTDLSSSAMHLIWCCMRWFAALSSASALPAPPLLYRSPEGVEASAETQWRNALEHIRYAMLVRGASAK